jgi:DNA-binding transcriptional regulator YiaG
MHYEGMITAERIKAARSARKETQDEFGAHFGVDQATIHRWESKGITGRGVTALAVERVLAELPPSFDARHDQSESAA